MQETYIVSGYKRCGTSMMMQALIAGGLQGEYDNTHNDYYELKPGATRDQNFPLMYEGKLFKLFFKGIQSMRVGNYRIVFMKRNPLHIADSLDKLHGKQPGHNNVRENIDEMFDIAIEKALNRKDVKRLTVVRYEDVIANPKKEFERIAADGWPINIEEASKIIDPRKDHHGTAGIAKEGAVV